MNEPMNVLFIYFNNLERTKCVFEQIKKAKPNNLFLYQDGPRNETESCKVLEVRKYIEDNIDWDCVVYKKYQVENFGCDPSEYIAQKWAFSIVDKCIILEDDDVPNQSFFRFCHELLIKYQNDNRIGMICGMNNLTTFDAKNDADYFFTKSGSIWGWATWRRVVENWDENYSWLDSNEKMHVIKQFFKKERAFNSFISLAKKRRESGVEYYETILGVATILANQLNIVPNRNMISNIGVTGGVHTKGSYKGMIKKRQRLFFKETYEIDGSIRHPTNVEECLKYKKLVDKNLSLNFFEKCIAKIKRLIYQYLLK